MQIDMRTVNQILPTYPKVDDGVHVYLGNTLLDALVQVEDGHCRVLALLGLLGKPHSQWVDVGAIIPRQ